jgi:hypothetical protein
MHGAQQAFDLAYPPTQLLGSSTPVGMLLECRMLLVLRSKHMALHALNALLRVLFVLHMVSSIFVCAAPCTHFIIEYGWHFVLTPPLRVV